VADESSVLQSTHLHILKYKCVSTVPRTHCKGLLGAHKSSSVQVTTSALLRRATVQSLFL
jgi:hypothetical protein